MDLGVAGSELAALKLEAFGWRVGFFGGSIRVSVGVQGGMKTARRAAALSCSALFYARLGFKVSQGWHVLQQLLGAR